MNDDQIEIKYKDSEDWVSLTGKVTSWIDYSKRGAPVRVSSIWQKPVKTTTQWNGFLRNVRDTVYKTYTVEFYIKESEIEVLQPIQSATTVIITDLKTGIVYNVDLSLPDLFEVSDPTRIADTFNYLVTFTFRTEKTFVDYGKRNAALWSFVLDNVDSNGDFEAIAQLTAPQYYDLYFEVLISQLDADISNINNNDGYDMPSRILNKTNLNLLYFTDLTTANFIKKHLPNCNRAFVNENVFTAGTGTVSNLDFTAGTGTVSSEGGVDVITFSAVQTFTAGDKIKIGVLIVEIVGVTDPQTYTIDTAISEVINESFEFYEPISNSLYFSTAQTLRIGQFVKVGSEQRRIVGIETTYYLTDSAFSTEFETQPFSISTIYDFLEPAIVQIQPVDTDLYQVNINATSDIFLHTPENI